MAGGQSRARGDGVVAVPRSGTFSRGHIARPMRLPIETSGFSPERRDGRGDANLVVAITGASSAKRQRAGRSPAGVKWSFSALVARMPTALASELNGAG